MAFLRSIATGAGNMFNSFLNPQRGYEDAGNQMQHYFEMFKNYLKPYQDAGLSQIGTLTGAENDLMHPDELQKRWLSGYSESPYAKQLTDEATNTGLETAGQQGLLGSSAALSNIQHSATNIMDQDRTKYLDDLMQKYMSGIGVGQNIFNTGAVAGSQLGQGSFQTGENMAQTAYGSRNAPGEMLQKLIGMIAGAYSGKAK